MYQTEYWPGEGLIEEWEDEGLDADAYTDIDDDMDEWGEEEFVDFEELVEAEDIDDE